MKTLTGKAAFITGGANGIGLALAHALAAEGMAVAITDIDGAAAEQAAAALREQGAEAIGLRLDVSDPAAFEAAAQAAEKALGPIRLVCSNAGVASAQSILGYTPLEAITHAEWNWLLGINLTGQFNAIKTFVPRFKASAEPAHILSTASMAGITPQVKEVPGAYTVSKFALVGMFEQLRLELADFPQIGITVLCPGVVKTAIQKHTLAGATYMESASLADSDNPYAAEGENLFGMEVGNVARFGIEAVKADRFYALTHPEYVGLTRKFHNRVLDAFGASAQPGYADPLPE
jgi:NAD(P)-dependent dehydrogenase (short-subunit alcohol dehydrogenase family)